MSRSASTPSKLGTCPDVSPSASQLRHSSPYEPSPASTYGESLQCGSMPATPRDNYLDNATGLIHSLRRAQLDDSVEQDSASPFPRREVKFAVSEQPAEGQGVKISEYRWSPPPPLKDTGTGSNVSAPIPDRYNQIKDSANWRRGEDFVRSSEAHEDDPFVTVESTNPSLGTGGGFQPRKDRTGLLLSGDTAQSVLPPNACVFVANLTSSKSDDELEHLVASVFEMFGKVYVKIRRDGKGMPFAFCQYENVSDAQRAITLGRGRLVDGRACRTEIAKVNRSLYLSRITGGYISAAEARQALARFGALEKVWYCSQTDKEMFRLPEGVWVMFAFFQDCRDAHAGFHNNPLYRLEQPKMPEDVRNRMGTRTSSSPGSLFHRYNLQYSPISPQAALRRMADLCSIFVGNMPPDATEGKLRELFGVHGKIMQIELVRKPSASASGVNTFAFIEYRSPEEAEYATHLIYELGGVRLRVQRKETLDFLGRRETWMFPGGSPRNLPCAESPEAMAALFQRGISVGMANAAASQSQNLPPPPVYAPYQLYPQLSPAHEPSTTTTTLPFHGNQYLPQPMTPALSPLMPPSMQPFQPFQFPGIGQGSPQYAQHSNWHQRTSDYQWPLTFSSSEPVPTTTNGEPGP